LKPKQSSLDSTDESRPSVLLLGPSRGLGGGIERYAETLESAFAQHHVDVHRIDLYNSSTGPKISAHRRLAMRCRSYLTGREAPPNVVIMHRGLLPTIAPIIWRHQVAGISLICHGNELWGPRPRIRKYFEDYMMRAPKVRTVATSTYTAGALSYIGSTKILPPGLSKEWFQALVASAERNEPQNGLRLMTAFRLAQWREKGLPQLLSAVASLRRPDTRLVICGLGQPTTDLLQEVERHEFCTLRVGLTPSQLASEYAKADLFVLATQPSPGPYTYCESFGLVLLEAQVAGTPVVAPAYGGSRDVFVPNRTGLTPANESADALAEVLNELLSDPSRLSSMGKCAQTWAREIFEPECYSSRVVDVLL
jgi:glycosyltransferase involved in cell wall biosynthesis